MLTFDLFWALLDTKELVTDAMSSRVTEVLDKTTHASKSAVTSSMPTVVSSRVHPAAVSRAEVVLGQSEDLVDHFLPITEDELGWEIPA